MVIEIYANYLIGEELRGSFEEEKRREKNCKGKIWGKKKTDHGYTLWWKLISVVTENS